MTRAILAVAVAILFGFGCRTAAPPLVPLGPDDLRPGRYLAALGQRGEELYALRGMLRLRVDGPQGSLRSKQVLVAARPARLRVEILGFFNQALALLVTDGATYQLFDVRGRRWESDPVRPGLLWEVAGLDLEPAEAVRVLLAAPDTATLSLAGAALLGDSGVRVLLVDAAGRPRTGLDFDNDGELRRVATWSEAGDLDWEARYNDLRTLGATRFAHAIEIDFPATGVQARLELSKVDLNPELPAETFQLNPLPGVSHEGSGRERR